MTRSFRIRLYTERTRWLVITTGSFAAEIYTRRGKVVVVSGDPQLKAGLDAEIGRFVANGEVKGMTVSKKKVAGRRDTVTHFIEPKNPNDPAFIACLWESSLLHRREIAGHAIVKERSQLLVEPTK
jgi:hypothetical protein